MISPPENEDLMSLTSQNGNGKEKPEVPPKPEHLVTLVRSMSKSRGRSGYYNHSGVKPPENEKEENCDNEEVPDVTLSKDAKVEQEVEVKVKGEMDDGGYEPVGQDAVENNANVMLDSNDNIHIVDQQTKEFLPESSQVVNGDEETASKPDRKISDVSNVSEDSALGFNLDIPKIDCRSTDMLSVDVNQASAETEVTMLVKTDAEPVTAEENDTPPTLPKRPQFLTVGRPRKKTPPSPSSSPRLQRSSPVRTVEEDLPPPLPPRKRVVPPTPPTIDSQPVVPPVGGNGDQLPPLPPPPPPLPPRPDTLSPVIKKEGETEDDFVARQRMISRSKIIQDEEEGDYDTIDNKSDGEEGSKPAKKKEKKKESYPVLDDSDATSYESYDDMDDQKEATSSSRENILDPVLTSKENLHSSPYSLTFPRFRSFRKSKRKANKGSLDNVSLCQQGTAIFNGELQYKGKFQWGRRYCMITSDEFLCYKTDRDSRPVLSFALRDFDVAYIEKEGKKHHIIRLSHPGFDTHLFSVDSKERADMWIEQFNSVGKTTQKNRMSAGSSDGAKAEDAASTLTPSQLNSHNSLSNISQASSTSDSTDTHSYSVAPSISGSQHSMASVSVGSKEPVSPSPKSKHSAKRPLSTPTSQDIINRAIVLSSPASSIDTTPSPSGRRHSAHQIPPMKNRRTSQLFGSWGKKKPKRSAQSAEPSAPMNFEVYEGSSYGVSVSGYMNIKSQFSGSSEWVRRYCRIKNGFFECYKDITDYRHEFNFPLVGCDIVTANEANHDLAIKVVQGGSEKVIIEPGNTLAQGRWLGVLIKETTCFSQPPPASDDEDMDSIPRINLSQSLDNLDEKVFDDNDQHSCCSAAGSDGYEQQAIQRNSLTEDAYDELKESDSENSYIENYGPEVQAAREAVTPGDDVAQQLDENFRKVKGERLKSDSDIVVRPKSNVLDMYAKVDKRTSQLSAIMDMEEMSSKRASVMSEYSDILSAVLKVSKRFTEKHQTYGFGRSLSFDTGRSLRAAVQKARDSEVSMKVYESFQDVRLSRAGSSEKEIDDGSEISDQVELSDKTEDVENPVILPPSGDSPTLGASIDDAGSKSPNTVQKMPRRFKGRKARRPHSEILYPEISNSFGSLDEISSESSSEEESSVPKSLPNLDDDQEQAPAKNSFYDTSERKKDSGICGDSNESISALIIDEGTKVLGDAEAVCGESVTDDSGNKRRTVGSIDKVLASTFVNTPTSVYVKEDPVDGAENGNNNNQNSSQDGGQESDHEYDDIDEKKRNSYLPPEGATETAREVKCDGGEGENLYDEIDKEAEGQSSEVVAGGNAAAEAGSQEHHDYADVDDKKAEAAATEEDVSEHEYDPIEFQGAPPVDEDDEALESEYEEYEDQEEVSMEIKQKKASELHALVRSKKKEWAQLRKQRLAIENQRIQSRDPVEKKRLSEESNDLEEKVKVMEAELGILIEEHRVLAVEVTAYFQQHGLLGRKMSMISVESLMLTGR